MRAGQNSFYTAAGTTSGIEMAQFTQAVLWHELHLPSPLQNIGVCLRDQQQCYLATFRSVSRLAAKLMYLFKWK